MSAEVMNSTRVWAARKLRLRDAANASLLTETATNSSPVSAPATAVSASPKPCTHPATSQIFRYTDMLIQSTTCDQTLKMRPRPTVAASRDSLSGSPCAWTRTVHVMPARGEDR
jgi:hypothetical protein